MTGRRGFVVALVCALFAGLAAAQAGEPAKKAKPKRPRRPNPAFAKITEDPALPRVLLIGDSISIGYTVPVRKLLKGKANVLRPPTNCGPTTRGLQQLDKWLDIGKLDVIHFNWGLHDLRLTGQDPDRKCHIDLATYEANLRKLVAKLKANGAKLIWGATTPVVDGPGRKRRNSDCQAYNEVSNRVMAEAGVPINDLFGLLMALGDKRPKVTTRDGTHFTREGSDILAKQVADAITKALASK